MNISVIVPCYNMENFIACAVDCLKRQNDESLEFLMINDGSTDNTLTLLQDLCTGDARFKIFTMPNKGYGHACNYGIRQATGDYIAIFEPDDQITPDFYSCLKSWGQRYSQADVVRYNGIYKYEQGKQYRLYHWDKKFTHQILDKYAMKRFWHSHPSVFNGIYRKTFVQEKNICFCETAGSSFQDAMFMVSLFYANPSLLIIDNIKYTYITHSMQSVQFVNEKIPYVVDAWKIQNKWLLDNGISDRSFFLYKAFIQMQSLIKKCSVQNKKFLEAEFKDIKNNQYHISNMIPTWTQRLSYLFA